MQQLWIQVRHVSQAFAHPPEQDVMRGRQR